MEKGTLQPTSSLIAVNQTDEFVKKIPLPNEMPKGIDFSEIPVSALKSATVESLIRQNEDLMARLSVALRKTNQFEQHTETLQREGAALRHRLESLHEQFLIIREKETASANRSSQLSGENTELKVHVQKLEKMYSDVFIQAQSFQRRLVQLERNQARLLKAGRKVQARAKQLPSLEARLNASNVQYVQSVNSYEAKLADVRGEIDNLRVKAGDRDRVFEDKVRIENQLVSEQRQSHILRQELQERIDHLTLDSTQLRTELKTALISGETQAQELARLNGEVPDLKEDRQRLSEQVESLQALWAHKQKETEQLEEKIRSLQKLNQSLSLTLNQQRKDIHLLNTEMEKQRYMSDEKIKTLLTEIQMLRSHLLERGQTEKL